MPPTEPVVIVGAGAAGLAAAAALEREGIRPIVLEADARVGGTWARRYDRLHLHTARRFSGLPFQPLPRALPRYVSKDDYARYLAHYAVSRRLDVRVGHRVERIEPTDGGWLVRAGGAILESRVVVVATGRHARPNAPRWPGLETFAGAIVLSSEYGSGERYAGRRVLVVGIGNSGAEIATDLVEHGAAFVAIAVRRSPPIVRRQIAGIPVQVFGMLLAPFPPRPVDRLGALMRRVAVGDLRRYGLGEAAWGPFETRRPPVIDVGFLETLKAGRIAVRPDVRALTERGVVFADSREEPFDVVVAATGFTTGLDELLGVPEAIEEGGLPRAGPDGSSAYPGLYFIGFRESPRGALYEANRDSRRLASAVARYLRAREPDRMRSGS